jgi:tetratricopeptide (TPR) repeat protein
MYDPPRREDLDPQFTHLPPEPSSPAPGFSAWQPITPSRFIKQSPVKAWIGGALGVLAALAALGLGLWGYLAYEGEQARQGARRAQEQARRAQVETEIEQGNDQLAFADYVGAEQTFRDVLRREPNAVRGHNGLGLALAGQGKMDEALVAFRQAVACEPSYDWAHANLGKVLRELGQLDESVAELRTAVGLAPQQAMHPYCLGQVLRVQGKNAEAVESFRETVRLDPTFAPAHHDLAITLHMEGRLDEAVAAYRETLKLQADDPICHLNLGEALLRQGHFREAAENIKLGHEVGSQRPGWDLSSAAWLRTAEKAAAVETKLDAYLSGAWKTPTVDEQLGLAAVCIARERWADAAALYDLVLKADPARGKEENGGYYFAAACAAVMAAGKGKNAGEHAALRTQGLQWLQTSLALKQQPRAKDAMQALHRDQWRLMCWKQKPELISVRGEEALARLPEAERDGWRKLWADVDAFVARPMIKK